MQIKWVGNKAAMASEKHFGGKLNEKEMSALVRKVILNATHVGQSDRSNAGHIPAKIIWGEYAGITFAVVADGKQIKKNVVEVVSFYDVHNIEVKAKRFNMKKVK